MFNLRLCIVLNLLVVPYILEVTGKLLIINLGQHKHHNLGAKNIFLAAKKPLAKYTRTNGILQTIPHRRHHIAHFCPSLDLARECIRTCMADGLAAFCGKDHVCYCGHKYSEHDRPPTEDQKFYYKDFKDMYIKYLGVAPDGSIPENM